MYSDVINEADEKPLVKVNALIKRGALHIQKCQGKLSLFLIQWKVDVPFINVTKFFCNRRESLRIIHGGIIGNPFHKFQFHLVLLMPYSALAKTILVSSLIFTRVENQPSKQQ